MNTLDVQLLQETAEDVAREAGALLRQKWTAPRQISHKGFRDWVTDADFAAQRLIVEQIADRFPDHGFLTEEESADLPARGPIVWIIDPIDGTSNFSRGQPNFCISIAAAAAGTVQVGVIVDPLRRELFSAAVGGKSQLNGAPIKSSDVRDLSQSLIGLDWGHSHARRQQAIDWLQNLGHEVHSIRAIGSAALALAWVAAGRLDGYANPSLQPWDHAAATLLIRLAGGQCSDPQGRPLTIKPQDAGCLASNGHLHEALQRLLLKE
jgi:myo-inositol-1(or 4)-monophosphatase